MVDAGQERRLFAGAGKEGLSRMHRLLAPLLILSCATAGAQDLFRFPKDTGTVWVSFENPKGGRGAGGQENRGAKGHPAEDMAPGETKVLLNFEGAGIVNRIWITVSERSPAALRSLRLEMTWDGADRPAVSATSLESAWDGAHRSKTRFSRIPRAARSTARSRCRFARKRASR